MADQGLRGWLKKPIGYFFAGVCAAAVSVAIYAGAQYFYQSLGGPRAAQGVLDNPASADTKNLAPNGSAEAGMSQLKHTSESFRAVARKVGPAVVNIKATKGPRAKASRGKRRHPQEDEDQSPQGQPGQPHDPLFDFFERFGQPFPFQPFPQETPQTSFGSGILIDKKGIVVTNNHVVEEATEIFITLSGDEQVEMKAKVVGTDATSDLAVLKIERKQEFPFVEWADSDAVEVGDWAIAIGSPFALGQSVTLGIVSAKGRMAQGITGAGYGETLIQTDAAINPGNSGGPLCDLEGKVMGVNTAIYTRSGGYMGIGFAIPSNTAKDIASKLISGGKIIRGWLGVYIQPLDPDLATELGIKKGISIHQVLEDSPAAKAGLKAGDVIVEVDGKAVGEVNSLQHVISEYKPGQKVKIKVISYTDKKNRAVTVTIGTLPENQTEAKVSPQDEPDRLGVIVSARGKQGVNVEMIQPGSIADQVGLEVGDIITRINRQEVDSIATYKKLTTKSKRLYLEVKRKGQSLFYQFVLPE